ncbi:MAG TPA: DUF3617 family protein [Caulobacteraceae bacterium]|jgi:hypothetical protein|nr:DUF3617 family protein [Caulobacteraceae bacterium]
MRRPNRLLVFAALAALGACHRTVPTPSADVATISVTGGPQQAPGLWSQTVSDRHGARTLRYCLDAASAGAMAAFNRQLTGRCSRHDIARAADGTWHFSTSCDMGAAGKVATEGVMRGDFRDHYFVEAESQTIGAADPRANGPGRVLADLQRLGDCPKEMKAGDVLMPDGASSRLEVLAGHA